MDFIILVLNVSSIINCIVLLLAVLVNDQVCFEICSVLFFIILLLKFIVAVIKIIKLKNNVHMMINNHVKMNDNISIDNFIELIQKIQELDEMINLKKCSYYEAQKVYFQITQLFKCLDELGLSDIEKNILKDKVKSLSTEILRLPLKR